MRKRSLSPASKMK